MSDHASVSSRSTSKSRRVSRPTLLPPLTRLPLPWEADDRDLVKDFWDRSQAPEPGGGSSAGLVLQMGQDRPQGFVDHALHASVLKALLGQEMRGMIQEELKSRVPLCQEMCEMIRELKINVLPCQEMREMIREELKDAFAGSPGATAIPYPGAPLSQAPAAKSDVELTTTMGTSMRMQEAIEDAEQESLARAMGSTSSSNEMSNMSAKAKYMHDNAIAKALDHPVSIELDAKTEAEELSHHFPAFGNTLHRICDAKNKIGNVSAPDRYDCLSRMVESHRFHVLVTVATLANCVFLTYSADWLATNYSSKPPVTFFYIDSGFLAVFILELSVRLWRYRWYYFCDTSYIMNWVDFVIVVGGVLDIVASQFTGTDFKFLRALRMLRLLKVLRVLRVVRLFRTLRVIFQSLQDTLLDLAWCAAMLLMIQYIFALVFVMRVGAFLRDESNTLPGEQMDDLTEVFGSIKAAMWNLFLVSMGGDDWGSQFDLLSSTSVVNQGLYLFFVIFSFIAVLNVILGIFVEKAMSSLERTREERAREHAQDQVQVANDLRELCKEADRDGDGMLSVEEWDHCFLKGKMTSYMDLVGFRAHDLHDFFDLCASHSETSEVDIEVFVRGCMRMRGAASCFDVQSMIVELHLLHLQLDKRHRDIMNEHRYVREQVARLTSDRGMPEAPARETQ